MAERAIGFARRAQEAAERASDLALVTQGRALEGRALVSLGRVGEGTDTIEQAYVDAERHADAEARRLAVVSITASAARLGHAERAIRWAARFDGGHESAEMVGEADLIASLALALLQRGAVDEAASQLSWFDAGPGLTSAYARAVGAVVAAAQGDAELVEKRASSVLEGRATYLDRVSVILAKAALACQQGDVAATRHLVDAAREVLAPTDDRLTPRLIDLLEAFCGMGDTHVAEARLRELGVDPDGWRRVWELATSPGAVRPR